MASKEQALEARKYQGGGKPRQDYGRDGEKGNQKGKWTGNPKKGKGKGKGAPGAGDEKTPAA